MMSSSLQKSQGMILAQEVEAEAPVREAVACLPAETLLVEAVHPPAAHSRPRFPPDSHLISKQATTWLLAM